MNEKKRGESLTPEQLFEEFGKMMAEGLEERRNPDLESKEVFQQRVASDIMRTMELFQERFSRGFEVLMEELGKQEDGEGS